MRDCCITWGEMVKAISLQETQKLQEVEKNGTPKYVLAVAYATIAKLGNFCPSCGESLTQDIKKDVPTPEAPKAHKPESKVYDRSAYTCPVCKGSKEISGAKCMKCLGQGIITPDCQPYQVSPERVQRMIENEEMIRKLPLREDAKPENWKNIS